MKSSQKISITTGLLFIIAVFVLYAITLHIDQLSKARFSAQRAHSLAKRDSRNPVIGVRKENHFIKVTEAKLNETYKNSINWTVEYLFRYVYTLPADGALSVHVESSSATADHPVLIVVREQTAVSSWQLPFILESSSGPVSHHSVSRTLCPNHELRGFESENELFVGASTSSPANITFRATVHMIDRLVIGLNENMSIVLSASEPRYYKFEFPEGISTVLLTVSSMDEVCTSVSVQNVTCPVLDQDVKMKYEGVRQTMTNKSGMTVSKSKFPFGFFVVFVVKADDYECTGEMKQTPVARNKTLNFVIREKINHQNFMNAIISILGIFAFFFFLIIVVFFYSFGRSKPPINLEPSLLELSQLQQNLDLGSSVQHISVDCTSQCGSVPTLNMASENPANVAMNKSVVRAKTCLYVTDLALKGHEIHKKKSERYVWNLIIVAIFYALPVLQLVIIYQRMLNDTGDQDLCYYNFLCTHPLGDLTDFNHVYSNLGYVLLGLLFIILTARKDTLKRKAEQQNDRIEKFYGIPQHFGLYYAMGAALMVEGVLSACYHICPSRANFQFDTTFMYVISMLCMLKIYQTRHPDINAEAHAAFSVLAIVVLLGVVPVFEDSLAFRIVFTAIHLLTCLALGIHIYYIGLWKLDSTIFKRIYLVCCDGLRAGPANWTPTYADRMILLTTSQLVNWAIGIYGLVVRPSNFASYILTIFIINLILYMTFYIIMKLRHGEKILPVPLLFIILSFACWAAAMFCFQNKSISWSKRAAQSRTLNRECLVFNFYDFHDIWHVLSATSLFFSFMTLLTLDDDLKYTPREKIRVF